LSDIECRRARRARACTIDGEAVVCDESGLAVFDLIRGYRHYAAAVLCAFDLSCMCPRLRGDRLEAACPSTLWGWGGSKPFRQKHRRAHRKHEPERKAKSEEVAKGALQVIISIADQRVSVYDDGTLIARSSVSTGVKGHPTPLSVFSVIGKERWHRSNIYSAAPMPYM
jgi:L,D-transpeptidase catalytic domain